MHICERIYQLSRSSIEYGCIAGTCRITGKESKGLPFDKWVRKSFTDQAYLKPGTIISNEALFCFDEQSEYIMKKTGRDKLQRFRTYSHIILDNQWHCVTKADKRFIYDAVIAGAEVVSLNDTGKKHILFKYRPGFWQLDELFLKPDIENFRQLHLLMCDMLRLGFSQTEVIGGQYKKDRILLAGLEKWSNIEKKLKLYRGTGLFQFTAWMLFISDKEKEQIQEMYRQKKAEKQVKK